MGSKNPRKDCKSTIVSNQTNVFLQKGKELRHVSMSFHKEQQNYTDIASLGDDFNFISYETL